MLKWSSNRAHAPACAWRRLFISLLVLTLAPLVYILSAKDASHDAGDSFAYSSSRYSLDEMREFASRNRHSEFHASFYSQSNLSFSRILDDPANRFTIDSNDVIVFVHVQKTAGTSFEKFLVRHLDIPHPCVCTKNKKRCTCSRPNSNETWLFSRYSTGWVCGLHADWTELAVSGCVDAAMDKKYGTHSKRRYFYTSFVRDPIDRFISEYRHVERGATWLAARHVCGGRPATADELPLCFDPRKGWDGVTLDEFLACPYNLAFNRQTRMLADLTLVNCYERGGGIDEATRNRIMLHSAKANLRAMAFYGVKERMADSQWMFERLFGLRFTRDMSAWNKWKSNGTVVTDKQMALIRSKNSLDVELYAYALDLFERRLEMLRQRDRMVPLKPPLVDREITFVRDQSEEEKGAEAGGEHTNRVSKMKPGEGSHPHRNETDGGVAAEYEDSYEDEGEGEEKGDSGPAPVGHAHQADAVQFDRL